MKKCRVCGGISVWELKAKGEPNRYYCSLTHLARQVNEAQITPYHTGSNPADNAPFWSEKIKKYWRDNEYFIN